MGALRKRFGAVRPEKGKVMGEARAEVSVWGLWIRSGPRDEDEGAVLWEVLAAWAEAEPVVLSYSILDS